MLAGVHTHLKLEIISTLDERVPADIRGHIVGESLPLQDKL